MKSSLQIPSYQTSCLETCCRKPPSLFPTGDSGPNCIRVLITIETNRIWIQKYILAHTSRFTCFFWRSSILIWYEAKLVVTPVPKYIITLAYFPYYYMKVHGTLHNAEGNSLLLQPSQRRHFTQSDMKAGIILSMKGLDHFWPVKQLQLA